MKVKEMSFPEAVSLLTGTPLQNYTAPKAPVIPKERRLLLPDVDSSRDAVKTYLEGRGIHPEIIDYCIEKKLLFQTSQYKNALFVGYDRMGRCAAPSASSNPRPPAAISTIPSPLRRILRPIPSTCLRQPSTC